MNRTEQSAPATPVHSCFTLRFSSARTGGRGLLRVETLADRWGCAPRPDGPGKTVGAEYTVATVVRYVPSAAPS